MDNLQWTVRIKKSAKKELAEICDRDTKKAIAERIVELENEAFPHGCRKIEGRKDTWRLRVGNFRIIYEVAREILFIEVIKIGNRKNVYKEM